MKKSISLPTLLLVAASLGVAQSPTVIQSTDQPRTSRTTLNTNFSTLYTQVQAAGLPHLTNAQLYNFTPVSPGGSLIIGNNNVVFPLVPLGVNGTDTAHHLYVSGGTGTAESCTIAGGSGTAGSTNGTIILTCAHTHSGAFTVQSATAGQEEASVALGATPGIIAVPASATADKVSPTYSAGVTVIDQRPRVASGYAVTAYYSMLMNDATPEVDESVQIAGKYTYIGRLGLSVGAKILAGSQEYEVDSGFFDCNNSGGQVNVGAASQNACVPLKTAGVSSASGSPVWGENITAFNNPSVISSVHGLEIDMATYVADGTTYGGVPISVNGIELQAGGNAAHGYGFVINGVTAAGAYFKTGIALGISALTTNGTGFHIYSQTNSVSTGVLLEGLYGNAAIDIANAGVIRLRGTSGTDGLIGTYGGNSLFIQTPSAGNMQILNGSGAVMFQTSGTSSVQIATVNYIATENGANNAIACAAASGPALVAGLAVKVQLAHTLQAGANTFAYNGGSALAIKSHYNTSNNIGTAYAATGVISLEYNGTLWMDVTE